MPACTNHPTIETGLTCGRCARPFCDQCLVPFLGRSVCEPCKQADLAELRQRSQVDPSQVLLGAKIYDWALVGGGVLGLVILAASYFMFAELVRTMGAGASALTAQRANWIFSVAADVGLIALGLPGCLWMRPGVPWLHTYQIVACALGALVSCFSCSCAGLAFWIGAPILLYYWTRPEIRAYLDATGPARPPGPG